VYSSFLLCLSDRERIERVKRGRDRERRKDRKRERRESGRKRGGKRERALSFSPQKERYGWVGYLTYSVESIFFSKWLT
jgi:hypothetical protein